MPRLVNNVISNAALSECSGYLNTPNKSIFNSFTTNRKQRLRIVFANDVYIYFSSKVFELRISEEREGWFLFGGALQCSFVFSSEGRFFFS